MFKKDNEQEEKYAQNQQQRMRGNIPPQYGQSNQYNTQYTKEAGWSSYYEYPSPQSAGDSNYQ